MEGPIFLTFDDLIVIHRDQLARYGGRDGIIDENVVRSALAQPQSSMFGHFLHEDIGEMAAAYLFHFAAAQGFVDGNKRTGTACAAVFLEINGYQLTCSEQELYDKAMLVANHVLEKPELAEWIRTKLAPIP